jgi:GT2 family glycosyltransferase
MKFSSLHPYVGVIVLCHNGVDMTLDCLATLNRQDYRLLEVIVVDNDSQDGTVEAVQSQYPQVQIISTHANLGYASGNNLGIQAALERGLDLCFLVNNDTRLFPSCVSTLVNTIENHPAVGIVGPMVHTCANPGRISSAGGRINWRFANAENVGAGEKDHAQYPARPVDFINGCGIMVTREAIQRAGLLDPKFFMYWEEIDWCTRVYKAGFEILFEPKARMQHKATLLDNELNPTTIYYITRNRLLFFYRYTKYPLKTVALYSAIHGAMSGIRKHRQAGRYAHAKATQVAVLHAFQRHWGRADPALWLSSSNSQVRSYFPLNLA